ncbi:MAG: M20 family metallopeptidase [Planctomycetales bacterium]
MNALDYARELVAFDSTSRHSNLPVSDYVEDALKRIGFETERLEFDDPDGVRKASIVAKKGSGTGGLAYFGHTDVVPADPWFTDEHGPFDPTVKEGRLYGRGSCDMKGSIACMLAAAERVSPLELKQPIYLTCTADEEVGYRGASDVAARSRLFQEMVAGGSRGIIGEPTLLEVVHAHKSTCSLRAISRGRAAHSSTGEGINANLAMIPFLVAMKRIHDELLEDPAWRNEEFQPPTVSWNIGVNDHTHAINITPPQSVCTVYCRAMPGQDVDVLVERARRAAEECGLEFEVRAKGGPLYTDPNSPFVREVLEVAGRARPRTVSYGTDGTKLTALEKLVVFGPGGIAQAHTHDEWIALEQLDAGTALYGKLIDRWCRGGG